MPSIRQEKIASLLKRELALIFQQESNTLFGGRFITVTQVRITPDLGLAKIYLSIMATKNVDRDLEAVKAQEWKIKKILFERLRRSLRRMPDLEFYIDDSLDYFEEIDRLLK